MDTINGFWILRVPGKGRMRSKIFPGEGNAFPNGTRVSVAAFTRKAENITRIPFVIGFRYKKNDNKTVRDIVDTIELLSKAFKSPLIIKTYYRVNEFIEELYIFDDRRICSALNINHEQYLEQIETFYLIIGDLIGCFYMRDFKIFKSNDLIPVCQNSKVISIHINNKYNILDNFFKRLVRKISKDINCSYIIKFNESRYNIGLINALLILKEFNDIKYKMLYNLYINLGRDHNSILNIYDRRRKIISAPKWNCKKNCPYYCGLNSPLHSIIDEWSMVDRNIHKTREYNQIPKLVDIDNIVILFGGCYLLRNMKFFVNDKQIHMGALEFILPTEKSNQKKLEDIFFSNDEIYAEVQNDMESTDIRSIRNNKELSNILSFSSDSSFIKMLKRRGPNYAKKINAFVDSQPFISSKRQQGQGKLNILQFLDYETFDTIFSYKPLHNLGFLERAIISHDSQFNLRYVADSLQRIVHFSSRRENIVRINIDINEFKKRFFYEYKKAKTIFTKKGLEDFYTTTAMKFAILFTIIDNKDLNIMDTCISMNDRIIEKSSFMSLMIIGYRDRLLFRYTQKYKLMKSFKDYLREYPYTFIYHRDLERKFSSYPKSTLNMVIDYLMRDYSLTRIITHNINNKKIVIYMVNKCWIRYSYA